jgi:formate--tetrahydrofolate ligase
LEQLKATDAEAVRAGLPNLDKHVESILHFGPRPVVALNRFGGDTDEEIAVVRERCTELNVPFAISDHHAHGGDGAVELATKVMEAANAHNAPFTPLYELSDSVPDKIRKVAQTVYGARDVAFTKAAERELDDIKRLGYEKLPVCIAKTQNSLSDDPSLRGRPDDFEVTVRGFQINAGAGFLVVLTGDIMRMPGLPRKPRAEDIDFRDGRIEGLQ